MLFHSLLLNHAIPFHAKLHIYDYICSNTMFYFFIRTKIFCTTLVRLSLLTTDTFVLIVGSVHRLDTSGPFNYDVLFQQRAPIQSFGQVVSTIGTKMLLKDIFFFGNVFNCNTVLCGF